MTNYEFITEIKTDTPYEDWQSPLGWQKLFDLANAFGDMIAVHVEEPWKGSIDLVRQARALTDKPILAKGINDSEQQIEDALEAGADKVLKVGQLPSIDLLPYCLMEPRSLAELATYPAGTHVVWNSRDLKDGSLKTESFAAARQLWPGWLCQASNIRHPDDVESGANAILVGRWLPEFIIARMLQ